MAITISPDTEHGSWVREAVAHFERPLAIYATRLVGDAETARDVVQDTFMRLCGQDRASIGDHLAEWLFTVCRNRALDVLRKEHRMTRLSDEQVNRCLSTAPGPLEAAERHDLGARVLSLLESLPPNQREVLRLKFQNGFSYAFRQFHAPLEIYGGLQTVLIVSVSSRTAHRLLTASSCNSS